VWFINNTFDDDATDIKTQFHSFPQGYNNYSALLKTLPNQGEATKQVTLSVDSSGKLTRTYLSSY